MVDSQSASKGFLWKSLEQYSVIGIQFILQIFLARILEPSAYGIVAIVNVFISFSNVIIHSGFSISLVREKNIDRDDVNIVFSYALLIAVILYILIYFFAPLIAKFYLMYELTPLLRVLGIGVFIHTFNSIQIALLRRNLKFKLMFYATFISIVISGLISIILALNNWGVWALAFHQLICGLISMFVFFYGERWLPRLKFNGNKIYNLFSFGWKVLLTNLVDELFANIRTLIIGKKFDAANLSFFNRGRSFPDLLMKSTNNSLQAVLLPVLGKNQDNPEALRRIMQKTLMVSCFVVFPLLTILAVSAKSFIYVLLGEKWLPAVFFLQVCCIYFATWPLVTSNTQALYATGHSGLVLKFESIRKTVDLLVLVITLPFGIKALTYGMAFVSVISVPLYLSRAKRVCNYSALEQMRDNLGAILLSGFTGVCVFMMSLFKVNYFSLLIMQVVLGIAIYTLCAYIFRIRGLSMSIEYIKAFIGKSKKNVENNI